MLVDHCRQSVDHSCVVEDGLVHSLDVIAFFAGGHDECCSDGDMIGVLRLGLFVREVRWPEVVARLVVPEEGVSHGRVDLVDA